MIDDLDHLLPNIHDGLKGFYTYNIDRLDQSFREEDSSVFLHAGKMMALKTFKEMASRVPAYKDFLKKQSIDPDKITSHEDLQFIPWIDKENYLKAYPLDALSWDGKVNFPIISSSSGSSGKPTFWPRSLQMEVETSYVFELFLKHFFEIDKYKTLYVSALAMGIYVGGTFTLNCCMRLSMKGYPLTIMTPGVRKEEFLECLRYIAPAYEQIILSGYPPLLKDILDEAEEQGISLAGKRVRFHFAAEAISEPFREYMHQKAGVPDEDYYSGSMNLYGTADAAVAGHESPLAILLRKQLANNPEQCEEFFGSTTVPSVNQFYPFFKYIENAGDELLFSTYHNAFPLIRYNIHDRGSVLTYEQMLELLAKLGVTEEQALTRTKQSSFWRLPHVYLFGKSDHTVKLYGALIYADQIKEALQNEQLQSYLTGKFMMSSKTDTDQNQYLQLDIECRTSISPDEMDHKLIEEIVIAHLLKHNAEYRSNYGGAPEEQRPKIHCWHYEHPEYFEPSTKHQWTKKPLTIDR